MKIFGIVAAIVGLIVGLIQLLIWLHRVWQNSKWRKSANNKKTELVSVGVVVRDSKVLMVRRKDPEDNLIWQFPSALVKSKQEAIKRTTEETYLETGVKTNFHRVLGDRQHPETFKYIVYIALNYLHGEPTNGQPDENVEVRWVHIKDVRLLLTTSLFTKVDDYLSLFEN